MATSGTGAQQWLVCDRAQSLGVRLDVQTGLPTAMVFWPPSGEEIVPVQLAATLVTEGDEAVSLPTFSYVNTVHLSEFRRLEGGDHYQLNGAEETYTVSTQAGIWRVDWHYTFRQSHPRLELSFDVRPVMSVGPATLRDVHLELSCGLPELGSWLLEAPGNRMRPGVACDALRVPFAISPAGDVVGSAGLVVLHNAERRQLLVLWPFSRTEIGRLWLQSDVGAIRLTIHTGLAGRISPHEALHYGAVELDAMEGLWEETRNSISAWNTTLGVTTPSDRPGWVESASLFEVQIGYSVFWKGYQYAPYPTVRDLLADLGRIHGLGYTGLQIMPRQPYPSYNVHDYADITTSYGDEADLRELVDACHSLGMHVILDILMHGVMDKDVIAQTADRVRSGPYYPRLAEETTGSWGSGQDAIDAIQIAWCRHILDFEQYWSGGSPARHPLVDAHPEWFMRDSSQQIIGIYTKAFDVANVAWQEYFTGAVEELVRRLDVDGFRFDAPTYNDLPNWSTATERRASYSPLGCLELFDRLRVRLKSLKESAILYTEPSGVLFRRAMDLTYNYDEQWLIGAVLRPSSDEQSLGTSVRNARDLAAWFRDRNSVLPAGSLIAHHIDSHDTFWWPLPGDKWRREQFGIAATRALLAVFALSGGAYMTFIGGEQEIEEDIRRVHRLRATLPEMGSGRAIYDLVGADRDEVYVVARQVEPGDWCTLVLVNLSGEHIDAYCTVDSARLRQPRGTLTVYDAWNDCMLDVGGRFALEQGDLRQLRLTFDAYQVRVLVLRSTAQ